MNDLPDVVVLSATRTAIGRYGGGLAGVPPCDLAAAVVREAVSRAGVEPADVGHAVFGNVIHTETREPGKEVKTATWVNQAAAHGEIEACRERARSTGDQGG